ncbi:MAG: iron ABC transporter permease [Thermodesulfobacteriota bacterium]
MNRTLTRKRFLLHLAGYAALFALALFWCPLFGAEKISWAKAVSGFLSSSRGPDAEILVFHRLPRVLLALLVGGVLSSSGAALQVTLKNPLAEPFLLGIAGAGAVGAVAALCIPGLLFFAGPFSSVEIFALVTAGACVAGIYLLASRGPGVNMGTILLAGVTLNILCGSAILLIRYLVSPHLLVSMDRWMMGGLDVVGYRELLTSLFLAAVGLAFVFRNTHALYLVSFDERMAQSHGVNIAATARSVLAGTGIATAAAVSVAGPIGFVGLIVPHAVRRFSGPDARMVLPASFLGGGAFLAVCDLVARTVVAPTEMPVGIITALIGGPVFLRILLTAGKRGG